MIGLLFAEIRKLNAYKIESIQRIRKKNVGKMKINDGKARILLSAEKKLS